MANNSSSFPTYFIALFIMSRLIPTIGYRLRDDPEAIRLASTDYGHIHSENPAAVLYPSSINDISSLIKFANNVSVPFGVAAKGQGHSIRGQAMARNGVVVEMSSLRNHRPQHGSSGIEVVSTTNKDDVTLYYADVGGEQLWVDVLHATLEHGLSPVTWTDYLYLTVGGTLSNAGIGGQTFRFGPQISNVYEMDVVTGEGDFVTCSPNNNAELFYGVLGGLGQFGVITRARIALEPAPKRVKWVRMLYSDFSAFSRDQERLISINGRQQSNALDYLEGSILINQGPPDNWRASSFFPQSSHNRIISQVNKHGIIYCLEVVKYYDHHTETTADKELQNLLKGLNYLPGFKFENDASYVEFLNRVRSGELKLQSEGLWDVPHPWLNLFIPKSRITDFDLGVFKDIVLKRNITTGPVLVYPMNRSKWNERMSAVVPEEDVFYTVGFLHATGFDEFPAFDEQNKEILGFCVRAGIAVKQYLPDHKTQQGWMNHFGSKWKTFQKRKALFDPKRILSPGQRIFQIKE
ncbi:cytokinin dehydrogenase 3-like [Rosa rugosa]|uniref:cytokinin dehydrogenase 3-like n=1 Tax=Rosa rugosa TaxID=74645 RepID=UPI002B40A9A4|nr:cytokinin dehydrogenase 3-like [Rosa rugosa]